MTLLDRPARAEATGTGTVTGPADAPAGRGRARRRGRLAVLATVGLALAWTLLPYGVRLDQRVDVGLPVEAGLLVPEFGTDGTYALHYRHHDSLSLRVPVRNRGPLPLRITAASIDAGEYPLLVPAGDNLPLSVAPWDESELTLEFRFDNCRYYHERSAETYDQVSLRGSTLGRSFEQDLALSHQIVLHGQVILNCPDRTLRRDDDHPLRR